MLSHEWPFGVDQIRSSIFTKRECIHGYNNRLYCTILCDAVESVFEHGSFTEILWQATLKSINDDIRFVCRELVIQKHVKYNYKNMKVIILDTVKSLNIDLRRGKYMPRIKIISNPYKKEILYQKWDTEEGQWIDINYDNNKNSKLLSQELTHGFFPFKVEKIVECIIQEYNLGEEEIEIIFEGSADEFRELEAVCKDEAISELIIPHKSELCLENARDILPKVRSLFQEMSPLIVQSAKQESIERDLNRFAEASSDVVPVCVLGNYSVGKSTFINALIGSEILPSGTEAVTAKIYKISRSRFHDRAYLKFQYCGYNMSVQFTEKETLLDEGIMENDLSISLKETISSFQEESIAVRVNKILSVINDFEEDCENPKISDLIEVEIPFVNGVLSKTQHPFVIFDTPGSNSASNARHLQVLKEAMANMTNGLPIFVSTPDALDSTDNENLYHIIRDLKELDSRFTMIVVNKADGAGIQRRGNVQQEQQRVLNQAVPKNLYSGGLFYISSILGLGAKVNGKFYDYVYEDIYDAQEARYQDPDNKHYRTLYLFNIMPRQLKKRADELAASQKDLVYVNSGLYTIEKQIEEFAGKYSAYNKCFQSQLFLTRVIQITEQEIENNKAESDSIRQAMKVKLEADKKSLIDNLETTAETQREEYAGSYEGFMKEYLSQAEDTFSVKDLKEKEKSFIIEHENSMGFQDRLDEEKKAKESLTGNIKSNIINAFKEHSTSAVKEMVDDLQSDYEAAKASYRLRKSTRHEVDKQAADSLLKHVSDKYDHRLSEIYDLLDIKSREYWTNNTESLRDILAGIVAGSDVLTEERRKELERIIITYQKISFKDSSAETIFDKVKFERRIKIGNMVLWESDHLNVEKIAKTYNSNILEGANTRYKSIEESHFESASSWIQNLLDEITENIVDYSPELSKQAKQIRFMTEQIEELEKRQLRLKQYTLELQSMMDWKNL